MRSMTGFGRSTVSHDGNQVTIELSAVNSRKQADIRVTIPRELGALEAKLRKRLQKAIHRGSVTALFTYEINAESRKTRIRIDTEVAAHVIQELSELASRTGISNEIRVGDLLLVPGLVSESMTAPLDSLEELAEKAMDLAIDDLQLMQDAEGEALRQDLAGRHARLKTLVAEVRKAAPQALAHYRDTLHKRIEALGVELELDDERLAKEVAFVAERSDITEETVRLESHLGQFAERLSSDEPVGRALEFLCQEMGREISTLCAKAADCGTTEIGLELRTELARIREQVMNVE